MVVTSGLDRIYPKGLVVGRVRSVGQGTGLFKDIRVEPSARFDHARGGPGGRRAAAHALATESVEWHALKIFWTGLAS